MSKELREAISLADKLSACEKDLERKLADVKRAKEILKNNPEFEELLTISLRIDG